jgi:DNA repair protein RadC
MRDRDDAALLRDLLGPAAARARSLPVEQLLEAGPRRLRALGLPSGARRRLLAAAELARRYQPPARLPPAVLTPRDALSHLAPLRRARQERLAVLPLDARLAVAGGLVAVAQGSAARVAVDPREVFASAIERRASAVLLAHNHPSGSLEPSEADLAFTRAMVVAGDLLGMVVVDHLLVAPRGYLSFAEAGLLRGLPGLQERAVADRRQGQTGGATL